VLDAAQVGEHTGAAQRIVDLEHHGRHQLSTLRDQRIVGGELVGQLPGAALLDEEHLVHLVQHGVVGLEVEGGERPDLEPAVLLQLGHALAPLGALAGILRQRNDGRGFDLARSHDGTSISP